MDHWPKIMEPSRYNSSPHFWVAKYMFLFPICDNYPDAGVFAYGSNARPFLFLKKIKFIGNLSL